VIPWRDREKREEHEACRRLPDAGGGPCSAGSATTACAPPTLCLRRTRPQHSVNTGGAFLIPLRRLSGRPFLERLEVHRPRGEALWLSYAGRSPPLFRGSAVETQPRARLCGDRAPQALRMAPCILSQEDLLIACRTSIDRLTSAIMQCSKI